MTSYVSIIYVVLKEKMQLIFTDLLFHIYIYIYIYIENIYNIRFLSSFYVNNFGSTVNLSRFN